MLTAGQSAQLTILDQIRTVRNATDRLEKEVRSNISEDGDADSSVEDSADVLKIEVNQLHLRCIELPRA